MFNSASFQLHNKLRKEAEERGETYKITKLRRNEEMDEYDLIHWRRSFEEREAVLRDISWYLLLPRLLNIHSVLLTFSKAIASLTLVMLLLQDNASTQL